MQVTCHVGQPAPLFHAAPLFVGLLQLARRGEIESLTFKTLDGPESCVMLDVDDHRAAIDLSDHSDEFCTKQLSECEIYFKRNLYDPQVPPASIDKVVPMGLSYSIFSYSMLFRFWRDVLNGQDVLKRYLLTPTVRGYEYAPEQPYQKLILFQARAWHPSEAPHDEIINEERVNLYRALRKEFPKFVVGGIVPTDYARKTYPDLLSDFPCRQDAYIRHAKRPLIAIYFRGLFHSYGFKMAEYLASSKCIIGEPLRNRLDSPPPVTVFRSIDDCLNACYRFLQDKDEAEHMRRAAWVYYKEAVEPCAQVRHLLHAILNGTKSRLTAI